MSDARANCTLHHTQGGCGPLLAEETAGYPCKYTHTQQQGIRCHPFLVKQGHRVHYHVANSEATNGIRDDCAHLFISTSADLDL